MLIEPQSENHGQNFIIDCKDLFRPWVMGDEVRMKQIIVNLLGNALKFTPPGGNITLTVRQTVRGETADTTLIILRYRLQHERRVSGKNMESFFFI